MPVSISGDGAITGMVSANSEDIATELAGKLDVPGAWAAHTPVLTATTTNPTLGTDSGQVGRYTQIGKMVTYTGLIAFGVSGASAGSGNYRLSLPVAAAANGTNMLGTCWLFRNATGVADAAIIADVQSGGLSAAIYSAAGAFVVGSAVPWAWTNGDQIRFNVTYEAA